MNELWTWVNFGVVALLMGYLAVKFGGPALRGRAAEILDDLATAAKRAEAAAARAAEIDRLMAGLEQTAAEIRTGALAEMAREAERVQYETARLIQKVEANAQAEIEAAAKHARAELQSLSAQLALDLARQKVVARMTPAAQTGLVDGFVHNLN